MTSSSQKAQVSQLPAIRLLQQLGYAYLSPEEVYAERRTKLRHVLLEGVLTRQLGRLMQRLLTRVSENTDKEKHGQTRTDKDGQGLGP